MKWLVIIVIVLVVGVALWVRTTRSAAASSPDQPHRLDDSLTADDTVDDAQAPPGSAPEGPGDDPGPGRPPAT